ncbi:hypothetical protein ACO1PF_11920 [Alkalibacterium sp. f15]
MAFGEERMEEGDRSYENPKKAEKSITGHMCFDLKTEVN